MFRFNHITKRGWHVSYASMVIVTVSVAVAFLILPVSAQEVKQKVFGSPEEAMKALAETVQAGDMKGVMAILGPEGEDILSSGDEVADKADRERFLKRLSGESGPGQRPGPGIGHPWERLLSFCDSDCEEGRGLGV